MTPAGTSTKPSVQNKWDENTHTLGGGNGDGNGVGGGNGDVNGHGNGDGTGTGLEVNGGAQDGDGKRGQ